MKDRIVTFIENKGISAAEFADQIGIQRSSLSHVLNGRNNPGFSFIQKILTTYPQINSRWLITGEGNMLNDNIQTEATINPQPSLFDSQQVIKTVQPKVTEKMAPNQDFQAQEQSPNKEQTSPELEVQVTKTVDNIRPDIPQLIEKKATKTIKRVLIFYDDHTFDDYRPSE